MESSKAAFLQRKRVKKIIICTFFCAFFIFGSFSFNDYGISTDEWVQRQHGLVNLKYVCQLVNRDNIPDYLADIPMNLDDYGTMTYYGIGIKIPLIIAEYLSDFKMSNQQIIHMNHLYTFLIFFVATLYVYRLLKLLGFDFWYTFAGVILFVLCPRTFADSFYNIKDSVFLSLFVIMLYYGIAIIKNFNWKNVLGIILSAAFCLNTRIIGCFPLFFIIIFYIFQSKKNISKRILTISLIGFISFLVYVLITPAFWIEGVKYILNVGNVFSDYTYGGPYLGNSVKLPWYYLTVSIIVTLPTLYTVLFSIGWLTDTKRIICRSKKEDQLLNLIYIQFTTIMVYDVVMRPIKYNMWRHFYFLLIYIVIFMLYGIRYLMNRLSKYKIYVGLGIGTSVFLTTLWIIKYHPFEYVYLNPIFSPFIDDKELDYWQVAYHNVMQGIENDDNIVIYEQGGVQTLYFGEEGWERFHPSRNLYGSEYIVSSAKVEANIIYDITDKLVIGDKLINILQRRKNYDNCLLKYYFTDDREVIGVNGREEIDWSYFERGVEKGFDLYIPDSYEVNQIDFWIEALNRITSVRVYVSKDRMEWSRYDDESVFCSEDLFSIISDKTIGPYVKIIFEIEFPEKFSEFAIDIYGYDLGKLDYVTSNCNQSDLQLLCDDDIDTRWSSNTPIEEGMQIEFGMGKKKRVKGISLNIGSSIYDFPTSVYIQGKNAAGEWENIEYKCYNNVDFVFDVPTKYDAYKIVNQKGASHWWSIHELVVLCTNTDVWWNNADTIRAISSIESNYSSDGVSEMLDNNIKTKWHSKIAQCGDMFIKIELNENEEIAGFHLEAGTKFEMPRECQILGSYDGKNYETIDFNYGDAYDYIFEKNCTYKYYIIRQLENDDLYEWSIAELGILR